MIEIAMNRAINHLTKAFELFFIWETIMNDSKLNQKVYNNNILGILNYNCYQMLHIKISIFFEKGGKHSVEKLINQMPPNQIKNNLITNWSTFRAENEEIIKRVQFLRNKYFAHYDNVPMQEVYSNLQSNENLYNLLKQVEIILISISLELFQRGPEIFDPKEVRKLTKETLD